MSVGLTNTFLNKTTKKIIGSSFLGVYPCDQIPKIRKNKFSLIINTGTHDSEGEHFVALYFHNNILFYFDPFGEPVANDYINSFIQELPLKNNRYHFNNRHIQDNRSNFCGFYCLGFLLSRKSRMSYRQFLNLFSIQKKLENDKKIVEYILKNI